MKNYNEKEKRMLVVYIFIFFLFLMGITTSGYVSYRNFEREFRMQAGRQLSAIAELKVNELKNWRKERMGDAEFLYNNPAFSALVQRYLEGPDDVDARAQLFAWLDDYRVYDQYVGVRLLDASGTERLSISKSNLPDSHLTQDIVACLHSGKITFLDFHHDGGSGGEIHISILIPIFMEQNNNRPLGVLLLSIDPHTYLYPYIQSWPIPSNTAETLLVRREGQDVLFLNELRFEKNAALNLRYPLKNNTDIPAVKAVLGQTGVVEGVDYRGEPVLADVRAVPDSPWFLVSKLDTAEVYEPLRARLWQTFLISGLAIFVAVAGLALVWRQQRILFYRTQVEATQALRGSEEKFRRLFDNAPLGIFQSTLDGKVISINAAFTQMLGYDSPEDAIISIKNISTDIFADPNRRAEIIRLMAEDPELRTFESVYRRKDGSTFIGNLNAMPVRDAYGQLLHMEGIVEDITERKQAEKVLQASEAQFRNIIELSPAPYALNDEEQNITYLNSAFTRAFGYDLKDIPTLTDWWPKAYPDPDYRRWVAETWQDHLDKSKAEGTEFEPMEVNIHCMDGSIRTTIVSAGAFGESFKGIHVVIFHDITERKQAEEALRESEALYRQAIEVADAVPYRQSYASESIDVHYDFIGEGIRNITGYGPEEFTGSLWDSITQESVLLEDLAEYSWEEAILRVRIGDNPIWKCEHRIRARDGSIHWVFEAAVELRDQNGISHGSIGTFQDITKRKQAEEALRESEALYRQAIEVANAVPYRQTYHANGNTVDYDFMGEGIREITGYGPEEFTETLWDSLVEERFLLEDLAEYSFDEAIEQVRSGVEPVWKCNHRIRARDGSIHWVFEAAVELRDQNGISHGSIGMFQDVTERKQAEDALRESEAALKQAQRVAHVGSWLWDIQANRLEWSDEMYRIFGYEKNNFSGKLDEVMTQAIHPDDRAEVEKSNKSVIRQKKPIPMEYRVIRPDKTIRVVWAEAGQLILDKQGNPFILTGIVQDITERKQAEDEIRKLNAELEQRVRERTAQLENTNKELEAFSYSVSHDLRAPLRGIDGWSQALLEDYHDQLDEQGQQYIDRARSETQRMGYLIDDMLQLSRLTRAEMVKAQVDLSALAQTIAERLQAAEPLRKADFNIQAGLIAEGDSRLLEAVLTNLLGNAFKFTAKRAGAHIEFGQTESQGQRVFFVRDNGAGFDMAYSQKLFGAFQRMHKLSEFPGTGIGLATVQRIIHRHGGRVWAEAEVERGATFYFTLE
jgi:PAS domain S-box-containing protein